MVNLACPVIAKNAFRTAIDHVDSLAGVWHGEYDEVGSPFSLPMRHPTLQARRSSLAVD
jgi:hypothetical protein